MSSKNAENTLTVASLNSSLKEKLWTQSVFFLTFKGNNILHIPVSKYELFSFYDLLVCNSF